MSLHRSLRLACAPLFLCGIVFAQSTTGSLVGTVADPGDAAVPGARVELKNDATGVVVSTTTGPEGIFRFNSLAPATYTLTIKAATGFKTYTQADLEVTANEVRDLGRISMTLAQLTENI